MRIVDLVDQSKLRMQKHFCAAMAKVVNIPCGHVSQVDNDFCSVCSCTNDFTIELPMNFHICKEEGCKNQAISMFVPCGCVVYCNLHAEDYIERQPCHQVLCANFINGRCDMHIDSVVDINML